MREIKFRFWNTDEEKMYDGGFELYDMARIGGYIDNGLWLQFTGLKDKNGKEIYEGDILENPAYGKGKVEWSERRWECYAEKDEYNRGEILTRHDIEIIGNIYENPELLNN